MFPWAVAALRSPNHKPKQTHKGPLFCLLKSEYILENQLGSCLIHRIHHPEASGILLRGVYTHGGRGHAPGMHVLISISSQNQVEPREVSCLLCGAPQGLAWPYPSPPGKGAKGWSLEPGRVDIWTWCCLGVGVDRGWRGAPSRSVSKGAAGNGHQTQEVHWAWH